MIKKTLHYLAAALSVPFCLSASELAFKDGDLVVLIGNTVVERAQNYGHLELELLLAADAKNLHFRNLGWSGDTVFGEARSYFGPPEEGFDRLSDQMEDLRPDVVVLCYGAVAAFEGEEGLERFSDGYRTLLSMIQAKAEPREIVLVSPPPAESLGEPLPDMAQHNDRLALYRDAISELAEERGLRFADLFAAMRERESDEPLTDNGLHYTASGYATMSPVLVSQLGLTPANRDLLKKPESERLRDLIVAKNRLYFLRWRPTNETYLTLFRKHEQGHHAQELPMFEPLVAEKEAEIENSKEILLND